MSPSLPTFFAGTPVALRKGQDVPVKFVIVMKTGKFQFSITQSAKQFDEKHCRYIKKYFPDAKKFKIPVRKMLQFLMVLVIDPETHYAFRGQVFSELSKPTDLKDVQVMNVDSGDISMCSIENLHYITHEYLMEPFDSFLCHLEDLIFFEKTELMQKACEDMANLTIGEELWGRCVGYCGGLPVMRIKDSTGVLLHKRMLTYIIDQSPGRLPLKGDKTKMGSISHVEQTGLVYLHMDGSFVIDLEDIIMGLRPEVLKKAELKDRPLLENENEIYLAEDNGGFYRCVVTKIIPVSPKAEKKVCVSFIDYGNTAVVFTKTLMCAREIDPALIKIPPLVHKVYLKWITLIPNTRKFLDEAADKKFIVEIRSTMIKKLNTVSLLMMDLGGTEISFNQLMIDENVAVNGNKDGANT